MDQTTQAFTRDQAYQILIKYLKNQNLLKHSLAAEAAMKGIYDKLFYGKPEYSAEDKEKWGITGLLHDADYEMSKGNPEEHGLLLFKKEPTSIPVDVMYAIKSHNPATKVECKSLMDWGIRCADQLTGLIVAATLVLPDKKIALLSAESVLKRMNEKSFAKGADREPIKQAPEKLGIALPDFVSIVLTSMQQISDQLGL